MNKTEMAKKLAKQVDVSEAKANDILNSVFGTDPGQGIIATELDAGRKVTITGFGTFEARRRSARTGRNPATGAKIQIAAKKYAFFRPGQGLKNRVEN
jgi:DNA-binding protein HU-beta